MSAGAFLGMIFNMVFFAAFWTIFGIVVDKIGVIFNRSIQLLPSFQDAINGFSMVQQIYLFVPAIVFVTLIVNYILTENSRSSGEV
jgi:hypothetical protein